MVVDAAHPVAGRDYPRNWSELLKWFPDDTACAEFTFRFNRRRSRSRGLLFYRLLEYIVVTETAPYRAIVAGRT